jgi:hypothetical protein
MLPAHCLAECFLLTLKAGNLVRTYVDLIDRHRCSGGRRLLVDAQDTGQFVERLQLIMRLNLDSSAFRGDTPDQCRGVARQESGRGDLQFIDKFEKIAIIVEPRASVLLSQVASVGVRHSLKFADKAKSSVVDLFVRPVARPCVRFDALLQEP